MKVLVIPAEANVLIITLAVQYNSREYKKPGGSLECLRTKVCSWIHLSLELKRAFFPSYGHHCPTVYTHRWVRLEQRLKKKPQRFKNQSVGHFFKFVLFDFQTLLSHDSHQHQWFRIPKGHFKNLANQRVFETKCNVA